MSVFPSFVLLFICASLFHVGYSQCIYHNVSDGSSIDAPIFDSVNSGIITTDQLTLKFTWPTYGATARTIDAANTGFVEIGNSLASLCASHTLVNSGSTTLNDPSCTDFTSQVEAWNALKVACGSSYFPTTTTVSPDLYVVSFIYRVTYKETLSSGLIRTVSNDYSLEVTAPTSFSASSTSFTIAGTTTFVTQQTVTTDASGAGSIQVTTLSDCQNVINASIVTGTSTASLSGAPTSGIATTKGAPLGSGSSAGLCPFVWTFSATAAVSGGNCNIDGTYIITYTITFPDGSVDSATTVSQLVAYNVL
jgi:hypothetical protein